MNVIFFLFYTFSVIIMPPGSIQVADEAGAVSRYDWLGVPVYAAHNYLAGSHFYDLAPGDGVAVDGQPYTVTDVGVYPVLEVLPDGGMVVDPAASKVFNRGGIVLQTCWPEDGLEGVLLINAQPADAWQVSERFSYLYFPLTLKGGSNEGQGRSRIHRATESDRQ